MQIKNRIRIFKPSGRSVSQNAVEAGCTEVRREGHVSTSKHPKSHVVEQHLDEGVTENYPFRAPKSHVVEQHPFAEPPEGHTPTALCEIPPLSSG